MWRKRCYDALGRSFTFQLVVRKGHKLITTGPYAIVRHPAYSGYCFAAAGLVLVQLFPGSYVSESGLLDRVWGMAMVMTWVVYILVCVGTAVSRPAAEDSVLREEFGREWETWARRTPYKLVPYMY